MPEIVITVRDKRATASVRSVVCDNTDYPLRFDFDEQWGEGPKTVFFVLQGVGALAPAVTDGDVCDMPAVHLNDGVGRQLAVGVQQGAVKTTTAAYFWCYPSAENELLNGIVEDDNVTMTWLEWVNANMAQAEVNVREAAQVLAAAQAAQESANGSAEAAAASAESAHSDMQSAWSYKERAVGASVSAAEAKTAAESARDSAQYARTGAQNAQTAAETAKTAAQTAQAGAEAARDAAQTARTGAQAERTAANTSKIAAQDAQAGAESAQAEAEAARTAAQAAQAGAEAAQAGAVAAKGEALTAIDGKKAEAVAAVETAQSTAVEAIGEAQADAEDAVEDKGEEVIASIPQDYTALAGDVTDLQGEFNATVVSTRSIDFTDAAYTAGLVKDNGDWNSNSAYHSYWIPVNNPYTGDLSTTITASAGQSCILAFLKSSSVSNNTPVPFASGETGRRVQSAGTTAEYNIPSDCKYICIVKNINSADYTPSAMTVKRNNLATINAEIEPFVPTNLAVNASWTNSSAVKADTGSAVSGSNYANVKRSAYVSLAGHGEIVYTRYKSTSGATPSVGMAFYSTNHGGEGYISGTSAAYGASSGGEYEMYRVTVPEGALYARFTYWIDSIAVTPFAVYDADEYDHSYVKKIEAVTADVKNIAPSHSASPVTACIIGASIEAGRTHDRLTGEANALQPDKAYLTIALRNNGITVTNKSQGGMGWLRESNSGGYTCAGIVDAIAANEGFSAYDSLYFCLGANDYTYDQPLGATTDAAGAATLCGQMRYAIETVYDDNPGIKVFVKRMGGNGGANGAAVPYTQAEMETAMEAICAEYGVEMISIGQIRNDFNRNVRTDYYPLGIFPDGSHPCPEIMAQMAKDTTGRITYK